jgi:hypothetical protein
VGIVVTDEPEGARISLAHAPRLAYELLERPRYPSTYLLTAKVRIYGSNRNADRNPCQLSPILPIVAIVFKLTNG